MRHVTRVLLTAAILAGAASACAGGHVERHAPSAEHAATSVVEIRTAQGIQRINVELARTAEEQAKGLMFRTSLAPDAGMLFEFGSDSPRSFWMKNTVIPLDMIFIRSTGEIVAIRENAVPYSLKPIAPPEPAAHVLEVNAGTSKRLGLKIGDHVSISP